MVKITTRSLCMVAATAALIGSASAPWAQTRPRKVAPVIGQSRRYCNPLPIPASSKDGSPQGVSLGDVTVIQDGQDYYLYGTGGGAWVSRDFIDWVYKPVEVKGGRVPVAPHVVKYNGAFYMTGNSMELFKAPTPLGPFELAGNWTDEKGQPWTGSYQGKPWRGSFDPDLFVDDDNTLYFLYPGRSTSGIFIVKLDPQNPNRFLNTPKNLFGFNPDHTWERWGEWHEYATIAWIEGPWMFKRNGTYYIEYSASGTQWLNYASGIYSAKSPLGPYTYSPRNPFLSKATGIVTGPGHGCVVQGPDGNWWTFYTLVLANPSGGRRIGMDPVDFDVQGNPYVREVTETPQWAPGVVSDPVKNGDSGSIPVTVNKLRAMHQQGGFSSQKPGHEAAFAVDGVNGGWWEPAEGDARPTLTVDLSANTEFEDPVYFTVDSSRIEFATGARSLGGRGTAPPPPAAATQGTTAFRYKIEASRDGTAWEPILDKTKNDVTLYTAFDELHPTAARFVRLTMTDWPRATGLPLGIVEFTVFGRPAQEAKLASAQTASGDASRTSPSPAQPGGIVIVPTLEKPKNARKLEEKDFAGYLLVYFKDQTQSAYLAISRDGFTFTDLNGGRPIFDGALLAEQKGVRDPHITRGPDGGFYLAMTDLHINGLRAGFRTTQWERPEQKYGWGNNRAIVLMKSYDLIHWTHSDIRVDKAFPELGDIDCSWAPETVYDEARGKMMVYFTIRYNNKACNLYYAYTDDAFTKLETKPERIPDIGGLDGDITRVGDKFHLYYVANARVLHAVSGKINQGYKSEPDRIDPETVSTEAPNLFKRLGTGTYVLMYDVYGARPNNMGFSETTDFVHYKNLGHFNEGVMKTVGFERPKHGAVTYLTLDELKALEQYWKGDIK